MRTIQQIGRDISGEPAAITHRNGRVVVEYLYGLKLSLSEREFNTYFK